jgi:hypothetical protein
VIKNRLAANNVHLVFNPQLRPDAQRDSCVHFGIVPYREWPKSEKSLQLWITEPTGSPSSARVRLPGVSPFTMRIL